MYSQFTENPKGEKKCEIALYYSSGERLIPRRNGKVKRSFAHFKAVIFIAKTKLDGYSFRHIGTVSCISLKFILLHVEFDIWFN